LPPALAGGTKLGIVWNGFSQNQILLAKANLIFIPLPPAKAGGNSKPKNHTTLKL
jgi:hypothetical protein